MYKISVPIPNSFSELNSREEMLAQLKRFDTERVFLTIGTYELDRSKRVRVMQELTDNCRFFKEQGFEVGAWIWTFWLYGNRAFRSKRSINGVEIEDSMCPTDENFVRFAADYIKEIAECGVDIIQFDDDFRYGSLKGQSTTCLCDGHIAEINRITGERSTREELAYHITNGAKNKYRDAFLKVNGDSFRHFAKEIRRSVNEVNPKIRISLCSCMSSWDLDGTSARELAYILAGDTKPLMRLFGAPYTGYKQSNGLSLQDMIEQERMESAWTRDGEIEMMSEGDVYPRPRSQCAASYLESFDTALRAAGCTDGILKYGIDYVSNVGYETGYAKFHERNRSIYADIDRIFGDKQSCGVRVYETMRKIADMEMPTAVNDSVDVTNLFYSKAARTLAHNTIPTVYEGRGVAGIVFDENARRLPFEEMGRGLILDIAAAEILTARGVDVGIEKIGQKTGGNKTELECFANNGNRILSRGAYFYDLELKDGAEILSTAQTAIGRVPVSYRYENADGQRFLVLNVNTRQGGDNLLKHYARSEQYARMIPWLSGEKLPAYTYGHPAMYMQTKKDSAGNMAVGLWNLHADVAIEPVIELDHAYTSIEFVNCSGTLQGDRVFLSDIPAFGFAAFEVRD